VGSLRGEAVDRNGVMPRKGMFAINAERRRVYGVVKNVTKHGRVKLYVERGRVTELHASPYETGVTFVTALDDGPWSFHDLLAWVSPRPRGWGEPKLSEVSATVET